MIRPFPRIPYLVTPAGGARDDLVCTDEERSRLLAAPLIVEEKLDGANVSIHLDADGRPVVRGRSGKESRDRGGQLGRLRAWTGERLLALRGLLGAGEVLYGEWLWRTHSVRYDRLPDWLVALDLWTEVGGFLTADARDERCARAGLATPPRLFRGVPGEQEALERLCVRSAFGGEPAEGLVLRREEAGRLVERAKLLAPGFRRKTDEEWSLGRGACNSLAT